MATQSALDKILSDDHEVIPNKLNGQPLYDFQGEYSEVIAKRDAVVKEFRKLSETSPKKIDFQKFCAERKIEDPKAAKFNNQRNAYLLEKEIDARIKEGPRFLSLPLSSVDYRSSLSELVESLENVEQIKSLYRQRKYTCGDSKNAGINFDEAAKLKNCFSQGRELYFAGCGGSLMVKPLNHFYAVTAYSYGAIVLNNPIRFGKGTLPSSHGMNYLPATVQCQFGGDSPNGTFSELFCSFPTELIIDDSAEFFQSRHSSIQEFQSHRVNASIGTLLSMLPEMSNYYKLICKRESRSYPLKIVNANNPRSMIWEFQIGDGTRLPSRKSVEESFQGFDLEQRFGKYVISVPAERANEIRALIYTDIYGRHSFIENPFYPVLLPEMCIHFLLNHVYSCIMRYRPDEWGNVILNEVSTDTSLLTRHYFSNFERKFFVLILRCISGYLPTVESLGDA